MRLNLTVEGLDNIQALHPGFSERRLAAAVATGLTRTAIIARDRVRSFLPLIFDRPTPYTVRALRYIGAKATDLEAYVGYDISDSPDVNNRHFQQGTPASNYMQPQISGGPRRVKRLEKALQASGALPSGWMTAPGPYAKLDAYGNVSRGQIIQVLSQLRITLLSGFTRDMSRVNEREQIRAQRKAGGRYFVLPPGGRNGKRAGIYLRDIGSRNALPVFWFIKPPTYQPRWDFDGTMRRLTRVELPRQIQLAVDQSAARMQASTTRGRA